MRNSSPIRKKATNRDWSEIKRGCSSLLLSSEKETARWANPSIHSCEKKMNFLFCLFRCSWRRVFLAPEDESLVRSKVKNRTRRIYQGPPPYKRVLRISFSSFPCFQQIFERGRGGCREETLRKWTRKDPSFWENLQQSASWTKRTC